jgi:hypothetical protein
MREMGQSHKANPGFPVKQNPFPGQLKNLRAGRSSGIFPLTNHFPLF